MQTRNWGEKPNQDGGDPTILRLGDTTRVRLIDPKVSDWRQHTIENQADPEQVKFVVCPGPNVCPLCRKPVGIQQVEEDGKLVSAEVTLFPVSRRFATNVWDYESNSVKIMIAGPMIFQEFDGAAEIGFDPTASDWTIHRVGKGRSTKYRVVRGDKEPFTREIGPEDMLDHARYGSPWTEERIFEILDEYGWDYDAIELPTYTVEEAEAFVVPFGKKHKGDTLEQCLVNDQEWCEYMYGKMKGDGNFGEPLFRCLHVLMHDRGMVPDLDEVEEAPANAPAKRPVESTEEAQKVTPVKSPPISVTLQAPDGSEESYPLAAVEALKAAGYKELPDEEPEPQEETDTERTLVPDAEYDAKIAGAGVVKMKGVALQALIDAGQDVTVEGLATSDGADAVGTPTPPALSKDELKARAKELGLPVSGTKDELISRIEEAESGGSTPQNGEESTQTANGASDEALLQTVKTKLSGKQIKDYDALLALFDEIAGKHTLDEFSDDQLNKLDEKLDQVEVIG